MRAEDNVKFVYFLVGINVLPHWFDLPTWVIVASLTFVLWKYAGDHFRIPIPNKFFVYLLGGVCGLGVWNQFGTVMGDEASVSILVLAVTLKLFEVKGYRDIMILTILCYFLLMAKLITSQSIGMTLFMSVDLVLITSLLALHHSPIDNGRAKSLLRRSFRLAMISFPIVLVLFFLFPRFSVGLFKPNRKNLSQMGFSDRLNPGSVAQLVGSDQLIFRARFPKGNEVGQSRLYWRGAVLPVMDELKWNRESRNNRKPEFQKLSEKPSAYTSVVTEIYMEPQSGKNLFALDWPRHVEFPDDPQLRRVKRFSNKIYESTQSFSTREYYSVYSTPQYRKVDWKEPDLKKFLQVNAKESPKAKQLVEIILSSGVKTSTDKVNAIYKYYLENQFVYSLENKKIKTIDDFLFETRMGFCEHFAGVTAALLRMLGVPSRVVVGFQGGKRSFLGDYYMVRAFDAHAWLEYWSSESNTWIRLDPTMVIAPSRVTAGAERTLDDLGVGSSQIFGVDWIGKFMGKEALSQYFAVQMLFDQIDASWSNFLLKYDFNFQKEILRNLGFNFSIRWILFGFSALFFVLFLTILIFVMGRQKTKGDVVSETYWSLLKKLHKKGIRKHPHEGPFEFGKRASVKLASQEFDDILSDILIYRYSKEAPTKEEMRSLKKRVKKLRIEAEKSKLQNLGA